MDRVTRRGRRQGRIVAAAVCAPLLMAAARPSAPLHGHCGAAARDPQRPCRNPADRLAVVPSPDEAEIQPSSPCAPVPSPLPPEVCGFGVLRSRATATFALVGDSHSVAWRAAFSYVAHAERWHGVAISRSRCPYTTAGSRLAEPLGSQCNTFKAQTPGWFARHPEVKTVFVTANEGAEVVVAQGSTPFDTKVAGYLAAWQKLPASVEHIVVVRDVPNAAVHTGDCIRSAIAHRRPPGPACARPRAVALLPDPAVAAAQQAASPRVRVIDLSRFMCDRSRCYPVVGGELVNKDTGHLTRTFSASLGPYLRRAILRLRLSS